MFNCLTRLTTILFFIVLMMGCSVPTRFYEPLPTVHQANVTMTLLPVVPGNGSMDGTVQVVTHSWSVEELLARKTKESAPVWADADELTFVYQGKADQVQVCCGIQLPMQPVPDSDLWVLTVRVQDLSQAVISYGFIAMRNGQPLGNASGDGVWRGAQAPPPVQRVPFLRGQINHYTLQSDALGEQRQLTVYLPPGYTSVDPGAVIYMADGQSVPEFAAILEPLLTNARLPSILLVGVHSSGGSFSNPSEDLRAQEYLPGADFNPARFAAHERFFVDEVIAWAERELAAPSGRQQRAIFGFSNGGVFAAAMGIRHPELYGHTLAFSLGIEPGKVTEVTKGASEFYLVAGTLEEGFHSTTAGLAQMLELRGVTYIFRERVCGHDHILWQEEFPAAVQWAFGSR
jgi:enterochelin esterase-like enzyme